MSVHLFKLASQSKLSIKSPIPSSVTYSLAQLLLMRSTFSPDPESLTAPGNLPCTFHVFFVNNHTPTHMNHTQTQTPHEIIHCVSRLQLSSHLHAETLLCLTRLVSKLDFFSPAFLTHCCSAGVSSSFTVLQIELTSQYGGSPFSGTCTISHTHTSTTETMHAESRHLRLAQVLV